jgi:phospholipid-binding lipoprotein MlaA
LPRFAGLRRDFSTLTLGALLGLTLAGCGSLSQVLRPDPDPAPMTGTTSPRHAVEVDRAEPTAPPFVPAGPASPNLAAVPVPPLADEAVLRAPVDRDAAPGVEIATTSDGLQTVADRPSGSEGVVQLAQAPAGRAPSGIAAPIEVEEYDPWEPFNEVMFEVNRKLDRFVLKPAARAYRVVMPEPFQLLIDNGFSNIRFVPRFVNSVLQGKWGGAGRELARFLINSTAGIGGLFDPAKDYWGIRPSREDFGQTLGVAGFGPGPYLVLPLLPPMTVRDGIGQAVDGLMDPFTYVLPLFWDRMGMRLGDTLNDRALNYDLFQGVEETTLDLYSSVRHFYLNRREQLIRE